MTPDEESIESIRKGLDKSCWLQTPNSRSENLEKPVENKWPVSPRSRTSDYTWDGIAMKFSFSQTFSVRAGAAILVQIGTEKISEMCVRVREYSV